MARKHHHHHHRRLITVLIDYMKETNRVCNMYKLVTHYRRKKGKRKVFPIEKMCLLKQTNRIISILNIMLTISFIRTFVLLMSSQSQIYSKHHCHGSCVIVLFISFCFVMFSLVFFFALCCHRLDQLSDR
jgi:hypothetical protein